MAPRFSPGDVVKLKSGGWRWTIEAVTLGPQGDTLTVVSVTREGFTRQHLPEACFVSDEVGP